MININKVLFFIANGALMGHSRRKSGHAIIKCALVDHIRRSILTFDNVLSGLDRLGHFSGRAG